MAQNGPCTRERIMSRIRMIAAGAALTGLLAAMSPSAAHAACTLTRYASADIIATPGGGVLVPVRIGEHEVLMTLQMNSGMPMITPAAANALGLVLAPVEARNMRSGNQTITRQVNIKSLVIGGADFASWILYVVPGPERPLQMFQGKAVVGTLSAAFMNVVDVELDLAGSKMNLFQQSTCGAESVYWSKEHTSVRLYTDRSGLLFFPMEVDGKLIETSLNTAGPRSRLAESVTKAAFKITRKSEGVQPITSRPGEPAPIVGMRRMALTAKEISMPDVPVFLLDDGQRNCQVSRNGKDTGSFGFPNCFSVAPFEIGTDLLRQLRIYIATKEQRVYFTRVGTPGQPVDWGSWAGVAGAGGAGQ